MSNSGEETFAIPTAESDGETDGRPHSTLRSLFRPGGMILTFHGLDDSANQVVFRAAIPFSLGSTQQIFRVTQPYVTSSSGGSGFADTTVFDLVVFGAGDTGCRPGGYGYKRCIELAELQAGCLVESNPRVGLGPDGCYRHLC